MGTGLGVYCGGKTGFEGRRAVYGELAKAEDVDEDVDVEAGAVVEVRGVGRRWEASLRRGLLRHMLPHCTLDFSSFLLVSGLFVAWCLSIGEDGLKKRRCDEQRVRFPSVCNSWIDKGYAPIKGLPQVLGCCSH